MRRLAALDSVCDFRFERREWPRKVAAGRAFRFWIVTIAARGTDLDAKSDNGSLSPQPNLPQRWVVRCEARRLADGIEGALSLAEHTFGAGGQGRAA